MVKVHLISITDTQNHGSFDVGILIDAKIYTFEMTVKNVKIGLKYFKNTSGGEHLWDTLQHHPGVMTSTAEMRRCFSCASQHSQLKKGKNP